jgi:hypothetical protein
MFRLKGSLRVGGLSLGKVFRGPRTAGQWMASRAGSTPGSTLLLTQLVENLE